LDALRRIAAKTQSPEPIPDAPVHVEDVSAEPAPETGSPEVPEVQLRVIRREELRRPRRRESGKRFPLHRPLEPGFIANLGTYAAREAKRPVVKPTESHVFKPSGCQGRSMLRLGSSPAPKQELFNPPPETFSPPATPYVLVHPAVELACAALGNSVPTPSPSPAPSRPCDPQVAALAENLLARRQDDKPVVWMLAGVEPGENTTALVAELAYAMSTRGSSAVAVNGSGCTLDVESLRQKAQIVLIDAGSLYQPGVLETAARCDGVCLILRLNHTTPRAAQHAAAEVQHVGGLVLGTVLYA
jgi:hypothetical protein